MFKLEDLTKEELIRYIYKMDAIRDKMADYIDCLEERLELQDLITESESNMKDAQKALRSAQTRLDAYERSFRKPGSNVYCTHKIDKIPDLGEDKSLDKEPKYTKQTINGPVSYELETLQKGDNNE